MKEKIEVVKFNEVYLRINCSPAVAEEISEYFTFYATNYEYSPLYKKGIWDGKIRLYNKKKNLLYYGLLDRVVKFCKDRKIEITIDKEALQYNFDFDEEEAIQYSKSLNLHANGTRIQAKDYQISSFANSIKRKRCVVKSPTASGKSLLIYLISRYLLDSECKRGLIIVPTISLVEQLYTDFQDYSEKNSWNVEKLCQRITAEYSKEITRNLTISTWQSIFKSPSSFFEQFDFVIGDEAHTFQAKSLSRIMTSLTNAKYRIGTTGTLRDSNVHQLALEGHFGPVFSAIKTHELMTRKDISQLTIKCVTLKYPKKDCTLLYSAQKAARKTNPGNKKIGYDLEIEFLIQNKTRNNFIKNLAFSLEGNTLILYQFVEKHGIVLKQLLEDSKPNRNVYFVSGEVDADSREQIRALVETENNAIIIGSYGCMSTGVNIRNLHNVIFSSPSKSKIRVLQSIGRSLRLGSNKTEAILYDIIDDLRVEEQGELNYSLLHFMERMKVYHEERFTVKNILIELEKL